MTFLIKMLEQPWMMWFCGVCGDTLTIVGVIMAATNQTVAGFTPLMWILLAMVFYLYFIMSLLARLIAKK